MEAGGLAELELSWLGQEVGSWTNRVAVTFAESDPVETDNSVEWSVEISPLTDLAVSGGSDSQLLLGEQESRIVTVTNAGPSDATGVQVHGSEVEGVEFNLASATVGTWSANVAGWTWEVGDLPAGATSWEWSKAFNTTTPETTLAPRFFGLVPAARMRPRLPPGRAAMTRRATN